MGIALFVMVVAVVAVVELVNKLLVTLVNVLLVLVVVVVDWVEVVVMEVLLTDYLVVVVGVEYCQELVAVDTLVAVQVVEEEKVTDMV